ncbi:FAD-dependent oxidoreductase [Janibacter sp. LM]|uniref:FAD-dependent oxidoreductase n=1 Tax=Janibacter sp. LM TaxID=3144845 RepID=UPI0031F61C45
MSDNDVIIVGAGPVGLITALGLAQQGVSVTMLDAAEDILDEPRGMTYHWAVLAGLERLGVLDDAMATGWLNHDSSAQVLRTGERLSMDIGLLADDVRHPYSLILGQDALAGVVRSHLERLPDAQIRWGHVVTGFEQDDTGVTVHVETADGTHGLRAGWLIGADGARSVVRRGLGLDFAGMTWGERFVATNCRGRYEDHFVSGYLIDHEHGAVIHKITTDGLWRHTFSESLDLPEEGIEQRMVEHFRAVLPAEDFEHEMLLWRHYRMHQRSAETYRVGRVLLAGDAAHVTNPTRGFGLVGGMFDAFTLTEALGAVIDGGDVELLDRYAQERQRVFWDYTTPISSDSKRLVFEPTEERLNGFRSVAADPAKTRSYLLSGVALATPSLLGTMDVWETVGAEPGLGAALGG